MLTTRCDQGQRQEADGLKCPEWKEASIIQQTNMYDKKENRHRLTNTNTGTYKQWFRMVRYTGTFLYGTSPL